MKYIAAILAVASTNILSVHAAGVGNEAAAKACIGFPKHSMICLTDISYVICSGDESRPQTETFVIPGAKCIQGIVGKVKDTQTMVPATATRTFALHSYGATAAPTATE
ncbi:hypothetical protein OHC33_010219 [Knufia fluminis]|uniref:Antifreeze protein n=2 Tax=Knufia TaxID=430999 RepID=A0AAN8EG41_9EURO|nr:hypothetical protein OHC33_010219 [Knufia fluminis]